MQTLQKPLKASAKPRGRGRPSKSYPMSTMLFETYIESREETFDIPTRKWTVRLPTVEDFADYLGVHRDTLYAWAERDMGWAHALDRLMAIQYTRLINGGLSGRYRSWLVIRLLKLNHWHRFGDWRTKIPSQGRS